MEQRSHKAAASRVVKGEYHLFLPESGDDQVHSPHTSDHYRIPSAADKPSISDVSVHNSLLLPAVDDGEKVS